MSIYGGAPWDILKFAGGRIITSFKNKFINNGSFKSESECLEFLKRISSRKPNSEKNPYKDAQNIYEDIIEIPNLDFMHLFKQWINENIDDFKDLNSLNLQHVSIEIKHQENNGSGKIVNAGIINNN